jgi:hypothetical protein
MQYRMELSNDYFEYSAKLFTWNYQLILVDIRGPYLVILGIEYQMAVL